MIEDVTMVTGGLSGLGLIASKEIATRDGEGCHVVSVSRTGQAAPDLPSQFLVEAIQDVCNHHIIKGDVSDASALADIMATLTPKSQPKPSPNVRKQDPLKVIEQLLPALYHMLDQDMEIGQDRMYKVFMFKDYCKMALQKIQQVLQGDAYNEKLHEQKLRFEDNLAQLDAIVEVIREQECQNVKAAEAKWQASEIARKIEREAKARTSKRPVVEAD
eukprot:gnl/TRDRNA2_/TRDRNA2_182339_c0_seq1.p1 gnl/TRDRNA2_/TRDRNA2_182339_c0~~gnl/TRDRNA2_/TRDRNA2_182339_c0_seq1.p1  ORF type:complete len:235 (-),score=49.81 gnl/TRDRNA2_/TRDRNA2_182339_c0_seq1:60-710(-)